MKESELFDKLFPGHPDLLPILESIREKYDISVMEKAAQGLPRCFTGWLNSLEIFSTIQVILLNVVVYAGWQVIAEMTACGNTLPDR